MLRGKLKSPIFIGNLFLVLGVFSTLGLLFVLGQNLWIEISSTKLTGTIVKVESYRLGGGSSGRTYFSHTVDLSRDGKTKRYKAVKDLGHHLPEGSTPVLLNDNDELYMHDHHDMYWSHLPKFLLLILFIILGLFIRRL